MAEAGQRGWRDVPSIHLFIEAARKRPSQNSYAANNPRPWVCHEVERHIIS